jgi:arylsulfatase A-like enzyme
MSESGGVRRVVLVTVDSLRADALGSMPTVRELAERGARFERAFAHGNWTPFSFPSLLGADPVFTDAARPGVSARPTLAERLRADGVGTAGLNAANGFLTEHWGYDRGFDSFETFLSGGSGPVARFVRAHPTASGWLRLAGWPLASLRSRLGDRSRRHEVDTSHLLAVEDRVHEIVDGWSEDTDAGDDRSFLWVHLMDTHTPYIPAPRYVREETGRSMGSLRMLRGQLRSGLGRGVSDRRLEELRTLYRAAARQADAGIAELLSALSAAGVREETCVVVAGDHGEEFMEHGHLAHYPKLYDELVRVPLVIDHPDAPASSVDEPTGLKTVPATIADLLGVDPAPFAGESLRGLLAGGSHPDPGPVVSVALRGESVTTQPIPRRLSEGDLLASARDERFTYVCEPSGEERLYDREEDPDEQENVLPAHEGAAAVTALRAAATDRLETIDSEGRTAEGDDGVPDELGARLEALGYR